MASEINHTGAFDTVAGVYHDGHSPADIAVLVRIENDDLVIASEEGVTLARWPLTALRIAGGTVIGGGLRLRRSRNDLDRLTLRDHAFIDQLKDMLPKLREERIFDLRRLRFVLGLMVLMAGAIGLLFFLIVPLTSERLVDLVPRSWEDRIGETVQTALIDQYAQSAGRRPRDILCEGRLGRRALDKMMARIEPHADAGFPIRVTVLDLDVVNAFAMPGGHLILFKGLLDFAQSGDEVAGVIAHEIAHVQARHPSQKIFEGGATSVLLSLMFGDFGGRDMALSLGQLLLTARNSREMELEADRIAVEMMERSRINPVALMRFLERINRTGGAAAGSPKFGWLLSHPAPQARADAVASMTDAASGGRAILSSAEFLRLRLICNDDQREPSERLPIKER